MILYFPLVFLMMEMILIIQIICLDFHKEEIQEMIQVLIQIYFSHQIKGIDFFERIIYYIFNNIF